MFRSTVIGAMVLPAIGIQQPRQLIFGGEDASRGRYPYYTDLNPEHLDMACGATLVAPDMLLTHPSCLPLMLDTRVGWYDRNDEPGVDINLVDGQEPLVHPLYNPRTFEYGFALLRLDGTSDKAVPMLNSDSAVPDTDTPLDAIGRGTKERDTIGNLQNTLQDASLPYIPADTCEMARSHGGWTYEDLIEDSLLCAGSDDFGACENDWGAPLVVKSDGSPFNDVVVGVFAWTYGCGPTPSVYSRVSEGYDWLRFAICANSTSAPSYLSCASASDPNVSDPVNPPNPSNPIDFRMTFKADDFNFENCYTLERIDGFDVRKVDFIVPGGIPSRDVVGTFERTVALEKGGLYAVTISDTNKDGLDRDDGGAEFFLEKDDGTFESIHEEDGVFQGGASYVFYATLDEVENPYFGVNAYGDSSAVLELEIEFDDFPWEFGLQLETAGGEVILYRPPRYWFNQEGDTYSETFPVPEELTDYKLTVVDTYGDGLLRSTRYSILNPNGDVVVESQFRDSGMEEKTFSYSLDGEGRFASAARGIHLGMFVVCAIFGMLLYV